MATAIEELAGEVAGARGLPRLHSLATVPTPLEAALSENRALAAREAAATRRAERAEVAREIAVAVRDGAVLVQRQQRAQVETLYQWLGASWLAIVLLLAAVIALAVR